MALDFSVVWTALPFLLKGLLVTLLLTVAGSALALALGQLLALGRLSPHRWIRVPCAAYIDFMRGTPLLVQLFAIYFGAPQLGLDIPPITAGILGLGLNGSAYIAETFRAGIQSIPAGQFDAARSIGMSEWLVWTRVILPQAYRVSLPPLTGSIVALLKDTSLVSTITVVELTRQAQTAIGSSFRALELYAAAAVLYFIATYPMLRLADRLERKLSKGMA